MSIEIDSLKINLARKELIQSLQLVQKLAAGIISDAEIDYTEATQLLSAATANLASSIISEEPEEPEPESGDGN